MKVHAAAVLAASLLAGSVLAQSPPPGRVRVHSQTAAAESAVKQAAEQLAQNRKVIERNLEVLTLLRSADHALADPMQPSAAIQRAYEDVTKAKSFTPEPAVMQGVILAERELEAARRSPASADFGRLRTIIRDEALAPASRLAVRYASRVEEELLGWIKVQEMISTHLRALSEITGESLRAAERER